MVSLANGCVCCQIRDDLVDSVLAMVNRPEPVDYIILEASGVADPGPISMTFSDELLRDRIRLDSVTCVVDADQVFEYQDYPAVEMLKLKQIGFADMVVLNKVDLAGPVNANRARQWIDDSFNRVRIVEANHCCVPLEVLLSVGRFDPAQARGYEFLSSRTSSADHPPKDHGQSFATWAFETEKAMSIERLREMVKRQLPREICRCKGIVHSIEHPDHRVVVQCVGRRTEVRVDKEWGETEPKTQIVAIGTSGSICPDKLDELFVSCAADQDSTKTSLNDKDVAS